MSAEFYIAFQNSEWFEQSRAIVADQIKALPSFARHQGEEYWLSGAEPHLPDGSLPFDIRLWIRKDRIDFDISASSPTACTDLAALLAWLRKTTPIDVLDDDDLPSGW